MPDIKPITYSNKGPLWARILVTLIEYMTGRLWIEVKYRQCEEKFDEEVRKGIDRPFFSLALEHLGITHSITKGSIEKIPETGPIIVVANHPFGIVDGLVLNHIIHQRRADSLTLTNEVLLKAERMKPWLLPIDDSETSDGVAKNKRSILQSMHHLKKGGAISVFPAGRLARPKGWLEPFEDLDWQPLTAHFVTKVKTPEAHKRPKIVPIFFEGENSLLFRIAAMMKLYTLTRSLVIHECKNKAKKNIAVRIGQPIDYDDIPKDLSHEELATWMRKQTLGLADLS